MLGTPGPHCPKGSGGQCCRSGSATSGRWRWQCLEGSLSPEPCCHLVSVASRCQQPGGLVAPHPCWGLASSTLPAGPLPCVSSYRDPVARLRWGCLPAHTWETQVWAGSVSPGGWAWEAEACWLPCPGGCQCVESVLCRLSRFSSEPPQETVSESERREDSLGQMHTSDTGPGSCPSHHAPLIAPPRRWVAAGVQSSGRPAPMRSGSQNSRPRRTSPWLSPGCQKPVEDSSHWPEDRGPSSTNSLATGPGSLPLLPRFDRCQPGSRVPHPGVSPRGQSCPPGEATALFQAQSVTLGQLHLPWSVFLLHSILFHSNVLGIKLRSWQVCW